MFNNRISRREFLKTGALGILSILAVPLSKIFKTKEKVQHKEARYYKNLAG